LVEQYFSNPLTTVSVKNKPMHGKTAELRHAALTDNYCSIYACYNTYRRFFPNLHLIVSHSVIKPTRVPVTLILHYVSNKYDVSNAF